MAAAARIKQGGTLTIVFVWTDDAGEPASLVGATVRSQIRDDAPDTLLADCTITQHDQTLDPGAFTLEVPANVTATWPIGTVYGDVEVTRGDVVEHLEDFAVQVLRSRTRPL